MKTKTGWWPSSTGPSQRRTDSLRSARKIGFYDARHGAAGDGCGILGSHTKGKRSC